MSNMISVASNFQYSVNIAYDLSNDDKLKNFIPTKSSLDLLKDILLSTNEKANERSRILIGAYGKGTGRIPFLLPSRRTHGIPDCAGRKKPPPAHPGAGSEAFLAGTSGRGLRLRDRIHPPCQKGNHPVCPLREAGRKRELHPASRRIPRASQSHGCRSLPEGMPARHREREGLRPRSPAACSRESLNP